MEGSGKHVGVCLEKEGLSGPEEKTKKKKKRRRRRRRKGRGEDGRVNKVRSAG